ncbi:MAG TPA: hypothetical protein VN605_04770, partial [Thermoanaerobaculia bacterium]|nr:hypothetical protein [Thermoanaerobaculia bacterium]
MSLRLPTLLLVCFVASSAFAATPYQVADLDPSIGTGVDSNLMFFETVNGIAIFSAIDDRSGDELALYRSDGTAAGTYSIVRLGRGEVLTPEASVTTGGFSYIGGRDAEGWKIWKTDGTVAGTTVLPIPPSTGSALHPVAVVGNRLLYLTRQQLWALDGGTPHLLATLSPLDGVAGQATLGNIWYFGTNESLWKTDGTEAGTTKIASIPAAYLTALNGRVYFAGREAATGMELWSTDGTAAGTSRVVDLNAGAASTFAVDNSAIAVAGNRLILYGTNGELGVSDGTANGTRILLRGGHFFIPKLTVLNGIVYFSFDDLMHGPELWRTDGTAAGTRLVRDLFGNAFNTSFFSMAAGATRLYFVAGEDGSELYVSDGTEEGTHLVDPDHRLFWRTFTLATHTIRTAGDTVFFAGQEREHGIEPWVSDGTAAGSHLVADITPEIAGSSSPRKLLAGDDRLFFQTATQATWSSDGTAAGTRTIEPSTELQPFAAIGNTLFLTSFGRDLRKNDGTATGTVLLRRNFHINDSKVFDGRLYINGGPESGGVWVTDGTDPGTVQLLPRQMGITSLAGTTYLYAGDVYTTDNTPQGTRRRVHSPLAPGTVVPFGGMLIGISAVTEGSVTLSVLSGSPGDVRTIKTPL